MTYNRPSSCKLSFKRAYLMTNIAAFSASDTSILTPCFDGIVHSYATSQELIKSVFGQNFQNMITAVRIQLTITLLIKLQKWLLSTIFVYLFQWLIRPFWLPLLLRLWILTLKAKNSKKAFILICQNIEKAIGIQLTCTF